MNRPQTPNIPRDSKVQFGFNAKQHAPTHLIFISGSHIIGQTHLASSTSLSLGCPWIEGDLIHSFAHSSANMIASPSEEGSAEWQSVYRRNAIARMNRMSLAVKQRTEDQAADQAASQLEVPSEPSGRQDDKAEYLILTFPAHRRHHRDALRDILVTVDGGKQIKVLFILLLISEEMLRHRFLGAETEELAERNFQAKMVNVSRPETSEADVVVVDGEEPIEEQLKATLSAIHNTWS